jgi:hypothetical protein
MSSSSVVLDVEPDTEEVKVKQRRDNSWGFAIFACFVFSLVNVVTLVSSTSAHNVFVLGWACVVVWFGLVVVCAGHRL